MGAVSDFIANDLGTVFLLGFSAGAILAGMVMGMRAVVEIAIRIMRGRA